MAAVALVDLLAGLAAGVVVVLVGLGIWRLTRTSAAGRGRDAILSEAEREAETLRREAAVEVRERDLRLRAELETEIPAPRDQIHRIEERVIRREQEIESKLREPDRRERGASDRGLHARELQEELKQTRRGAQAELERIAGLTAGEAKQHLLEQAEDVVRHDHARRVRQMEEEARTESRRRARSLVADALQRVAASHAAETTVSLVELPSDDMKGRIIGREGRNIRALEHLTGVNIIIDDTPQAVVLSSFDPVRREVARLTLTKLIEDGRIHPPRIEETYYLAKSALEVVHLGGIMASELGAGVKTTKRAAMLHDIGKAVSHEVNGSHAQISTQLARRYGEAHHYEVQPQTVEAVLLIAADAISASRPGARGESLENYIRRLEALELIAAQKPGVERVYALQAGREVRVIVEPGEIDDDAAILLSHEIAREIEEQLEYPGQVKVTVIRESRAVDYAK